jgi:hypothetical protein
MDKKLVELLLPVVNDASVMDALAAYLKYRSDLTLKALDSAVGDQALGQIQGRRTELNELTKLRDLVNAKSKEFRQ